MPLSFECKSVVYKISGVGNSDLQEINLVTGSVRMIKANIGFQGNALAYNVQDDFLYAINNQVSPRQIYRICVDGSVESLGTGSPQLPDDRYNAGTIDTDGYYYIKTSDGQRYYTYDLTSSSSLTYLQMVDPKNGFAPDIDGVGTPLTGTDFTAVDWAYNPLDRKLYGINNDGTVKRINPLTGVVETLNISGLPLTDYGTVYFNQNGEFYIINSNNQIYKMDDLGSSATTIRFSQIVVSGNNDEASYINSPINVDYDVKVQSGRANLSLVSKLVDKSEARVGEEVIYTVAFTNTGNLDATNVVLTDQLPNGTSYVQDSTNSNVPITGNPTSTINLTNPVAPGQTVVIIFKAKIDILPVSNPISNIAIVNYEYKPDMNEPTIIESVISNMVITNIIDNPQLAPVTDREETNEVITEVRNGNIPITGVNALKKESDKSSTTPGDIITYTVTGINDGNVAINNVIVDDTLPIGTSYVAGSTKINGIPVSQNPVTGINVGTVLPGNKFNVSFEVVVLEASPNLIINTADVRYTYIADPNEIPIEVSEITNEVSVENLRPDIKIIKNSNKIAAVEGEVIRYSIEVTNNGAIDVGDVVVKDPLAEGLEFVGNMTLNGVPITGDITQGIEIAFLPINAMIEIGFDAKVEKVEGLDSSLTNKSSVDYKYRVDSQTPIYSDTNESNEVVVNVFETPIDISKNTNKELVKLGDTFIYTVKIINDAILDAENILIKDVIPPELKVQQVKVNGVLVAGNLETGIFVGPLPKNQAMLIEILVEAVGKLAKPFKNIINATLLFRPDPSKPPVGVEISVEDEGVIDRDQSRPYQGVVIVNPNVSVVKSTDREEVAIGDIITYKLVIENTGNVDVYDLIIRDMIDARLKFIENSVAINGVVSPTEDILAGILIDSLAIDESIVVTFDIEVIGEGLIPNKAMVEYVYKSAINNVNQAGRNDSNIEYINASNVNLTVTKASDKDFVVLNDIITYTVTITNKTKIIASNVLVRDIFPRYLEAVPGSFALNGNYINNVNVANGINIGVLNSGQSAIIQYQAKVVSNQCNNTIENGVSVNYNYTLPNGILGKKYLPPVGAQVNTLKMGIANFKQFSIESYLEIPDAKPDLECINSAKGSIQIKNCHVIETTPNISNEGQQLTGHKLIVSGLVNLVIEYTALCDVQAVHSAHYCLPFSTFVILPRDYSAGSKLDLQGVVEDVYYKALDEREFFTNITTLINVKVLFC